MHLLLTGRTLLVTSKMSFAEIRTDKGYKLWAKNFRDDWWYFNVYLDFEN